MNIRLEYLHKKRIWHCKFYCIRVLFFKSYQMHQVSMQLKQLRNDRVNWWSHDV